MTQRLLKAFGFIVTALTLTACNGSSGENDETDPLEDLAPVLAISVEVLDSNCEAVTGNAFIIGEQLCVQASLTENGEAVSGQVVSFTADIGALSPATKLTDDNGLAQIAINSVDATLGAGTITASYNNTVGSANYEFLSGSVITPSTASLSIDLLGDNGSPITRFRADEEVQVRIQLVDEDDMPIANQIVQLQSTSGSLSISQALTGDTGFAQATLTPNEAELGAGTITATYSQDETTLSDSLNYEVQSVDTVNDSLVRFGYFDGENFIENTIGFANSSESDDVTISAGATLGILVGLADENDQPITTSTPITFTSRCVANGQASLDTQVNTINGSANATYEDISCAGGAGNEDTISATINVNSSTITISRSLTLAPESVGAIEFVSAAPSSIVLQGTGGQGSQSVSTLTFQVNGAEGNPLAQQTVNFSLNTETGGLTLSPATGLTNSQGQVSVKVTAGNVPTSVRVTAEVSVSDTQTIQTQSDLLSVNTGLPDQNSFTLSASNLNPEAFNINGQQVTFTASLADTFNNPVPDGTAIAFTTEGGNIDPSCTTISGVCSVTWTSSNPRADDHRITILATAIGHETLVDSNGNNQYDDADGGPISTNDGSGFDLTLPTSTGFVDLSEAWRDDNENGLKDVNEIFLDFDSSGDFNGQNGAFDGPQCTASSCGNTSLHVRRAKVIITSSSSALIAVTSGGSEIASTQTPTPTAPVSVIARGGSQVFSFTYSDTQLQAIASGSTIQVGTNFGEVAGDINFVMPQTTRAGSRSAVFSLTNTLGVLDTTTDATITLTITSPSGVVSQVSFIVTLS
ncbi:Ig-like protein, group 1 [Glaciecola sp. MH2013]|uniref:Ig-like protein, group 1 n=1 Tax=Glaciecola sp. MH2013 TaxID=2785524 RepID=UPI00189D54FD|nr:Ig-like protein, group 1 [Glaciecola sp. MH2013]MBF7074205.1 Ig-like protein, group 1 [Glaciecola sp. MH2013]